MPFVLCGEGFVLLFSLTIKLSIVILPGYHLIKFSYIETRVGSIMECAQLCLQENGQCLSINIERKGSSGGYKCELNNSTKENHIKNFRQNADYSYFEPINVCVYFLFLMLTNPPAFNYKIYLAFLGLGQW